MLILLVHGIRKKNSHGMKQKPYLEVRHTIVVLFIVLYSYNAVLLYIFFTIISVGQGRRVGLARRFLRHLVFTNPRPALSTSLA